MDDSSDVDFPLHFDEAHASPDGAPVSEWSPRLQSFSPDHYADHYADLVIDLAQELEAPDLDGDRLEIQGGSPPARSSDVQSVHGAPSLSINSSLYRRTDSPPSPASRRSVRSWMSRDDSPFRDPSQGSVHSRNLWLADSGADYMSEPDRRPSPVPAFELADEFDDDEADGADHEPVHDALPPPAPSRRQSPVDLTAPSPPSPRQAERVYLPPRGPAQQYYLADRVAQRIAEQRSPWRVHHRQSPPRGHRARPRDELVRMEVERRREARREARRRRAEIPAAGAQRPQTVIDLTVEPDSPLLQARIAPPHRNPRRQMSLNHRTPSLARSDGSILLEPARPPVIDLTEDSPEEAPAPAPAAAAARDAHGGRQRHHHHHHHHPPPPNRHNPPPRRPAEPDLAFMGIFAGMNALNRHEGGDGGLFGLNRFRFGDVFTRFGRRHGLGAPQLDIDPNDIQEVEFIGREFAFNAAMDNPLLGNPVQFNYQANGFGQPRAGTPKPAHVPPPQAREGFTRNTGEDVVAVCASCEEELKYDPEATDEGPPAKRPRTRKDREEHHFWAVPACGHVYCRSCYENRHQTGKKDKTGTLHFRQEGKSLRCAVADCESDVKLKKSWLGIFL